ncbi:helix-turn-helix transcriptional regulator [Nakamurella leprariae]|uniref:Transcriptional regulator n=1 Tax=Nakamurella leprariae TaxID=2803911 RepID=A0A938YEB7_9ACTN|nr:metalloregulator ArsR/SmtB family transcription factor [Nakamurella leprariae]MBM9466203.1 transcriptional regulator [Nakamurella leprariae]
MPAEGRTRDAVIRLLMADGPLTAADLARRLGLTSAGVRRHLDQLIEDGSVTSRAAGGPSRSRGRGRPARAFLLTEAGRARLPHSYDTVAVEALRFLGEQVGPEALERFARQRAETMLAPYREALTDAPDVTAKLEVLGRAFTDAGFAASVQEMAGAQAAIGRAGAGRQLCLHHCPVASVAAEFPQLCHEELAVVTEALGTYAQRVATIARGDSFCTTFIPVGALGAGPPSTAGTLSTATPNTPSTAAPSSSDGRTC